VVPRSPEAVLASRLVGAGRLATARGYRLTAEDRLRGEVIERLMCDFEADVPGIAARHGMDPALLLERNVRLEALAGTAWQPSRTVSSAA
jgi:oxygen-independent coproporphyrinogen-3 oxidase